jgi:sugar/nucleoside kinase (ribokinase family)
MQKKFNVVAAGRAYTDIVAHVAEDFLHAHQIPLDGQRQCSVAELKAVQDGMADPQFIAGGPGANTVAVVASLGGRAGYFGKVFPDDAGRHFLKDFELRDVAWCCPCFSESGEMSATCLVLLHEDLRSFAYQPGCADNFSIADFASFDFESADFFLVEAHLLTSDIAAQVITQAIQFAKNKSSLVINLQGITSWVNYDAAIKTIVSSAAIIVGNQLEQTALAHALKNRALRTPASQLCVTTQGADGAQLHRAGKIICKVPAILPRQLVSVLGAGDAFIAGFLMTLSSGKDWQTSMLRGTETAAAILEVTGARLAIL